MKRSTFSGITSSDESNRPGYRNAQSWRAKPIRFSDRAAKALRNAETYDRRAAEAREKVEGLEAQVLDLEGRLEAIQAAKAAAEEERGRAQEEAHAAQDRAATAEARLREVDQIIGVCSGWGQNDTVRWSSYVCSVSLISL
jgi:outer membrane murein-binding lipoprotein Lpp